MLEKLGTLALVTSIVSISDKFCPLQGFAQPVSRWSAIHIYHKENCCAFLESREFVYQVGFALLERWVFII